MQQKHKHYDVIVAWAEGRDVQFFNEVSRAWEDYGFPDHTPSFFLDTQWRVKPDTQVIKHRRWLYHTGKSYGISLFEEQEHYNPERDNRYFVKWIDEDWIEYEVSE